MPDAASTCTSATWPYSSPISFRSRRATAPVSSSASTITRPATMCRPPREPEQRRHLRLAGRHLAHRHPAELVLHGGRHRHPGHSLSVIATTPPLRVPVVRLPKSRHFPVEMSAAHSTCRSPDRPPCSPPAGDRPSTSAQRHRQLDRVVPRGSGTATSCRSRTAPSRCAARRQTLRQRHRGTVREHGVDPRFGACAESTSRCCSGENPSVSPGLGGQVQHHQPIGETARDRRGHVGQQQVRQHAGERRSGTEGDQIGRARSRPVPPGRRSHRRVRG